MYTTEILRKENTHANSKVNLARKNFGYEEQDIIVSFNYGTAVAMYTELSAKMELENELDKAIVRDFSLEDCAAALLEKLNK